MFIGYLMKYNIGTCVSNLYLYDCHVMIDSYEKRTINSYIYSTKYYNSNNIIRLILDLSNTIMTYLVFFVL